MKCHSRPSVLPRNFHQNGEGTVEEIGFEEFLVVMSHFRPPSLNMTEEQRERVRREKLRCEPTFERKTNKLTSQNKK